MKKLRPLVILVLLNLIIGLFILPDFGESADEHAQHGYAGRTTQAIRTVWNTGKLSDYFFKEKPKQGSHGPAFIVLADLLRDALLPEAGSVERMHFSHYLYFMIFQVGTVSLFFLAKRWMSEKASLGTALLFNFQPLLLGHAFMNPKDVVFMSLLIASAALALWMMDREQVIMPTGKPILDGVRSFLRQFLCADVWLAGFVLGFASAIRIAAPLIGLVILVYIVFSRKWQSLYRFAAYGLIAFGFMILFWPYLWPDPIGRLIECILNCAHFPEVHYTLFQGTLLDSNNTPRSYLPILLSIQLTEPTLFLIAIGALALLRKVQRDLVGLIAVWFVLPVAAIILLRVSLYNNFRQVFFLLPPLFLLAGQGLDWIFAYIRRPSLHIMILVLALLPGLHADVVLHPYQYIYYNQLVGGVSGAFRSFELDYWDLAFMEAQIYINEVADQNANVLVGDSRPSIESFTRPDLCFNIFGNQTKNREKYDYIIVSTTQNHDQKFAKFQTVFTVERDGVPLIVVKKP